MPLDRMKDAQRLDYELWPNRQQGCTAYRPIERRLCKLGGVKALAVGHFDEHSHGSTDVHTLVDGLAEAAICLHSLTRHMKT